MRRLTFTVYEFLALLLAVFLLADTPKASEGAKAVSVLFVLSIVFLLGSVSPFVALSLISRVFSFLLQSWSYF